MVDLDSLRMDARRGYELGRVRFAGRIIAVIAPLAAVCWWETRASLKCAVFAVGLIALAMGLRRRNQRGVEDVNAGLLAGLVPAGTALLICHFAPTCPETLLVGTCVAAGALAGIAIGRYVIVNHLGQRGMAAGLIALLTASLGCVGVGIGVTFGIAVAMVVSSTVIVLAKA